MRGVLLAAALVVAIPRAAHADGTGVIATSVDGDRGRVAAAMLGAVAETGGARRLVADALAEARGALAAGAVPVEELARFRAVRAAIAEGWGAYLRVSVDFAAARLAAAREDAEPLVALPGGAALYADASLRLGAVLLHQGRQAEGRAVLALALALDPDRPVTTAEFSPDIVDAVAAVRAAPAPGQTVRIASAPPAALIEVDGVPRGAGPVELELARGQHVVAARAPGYAARAVGVAIDAGTTSVRVELEADGDSARLVRGAALGLDATDAQLLVDAATRFAELDEVVLAAVVERRGELALRVQRCAGLPARCSAVAEVGFGDPAGLPAAARAAWAAARSGALAEAPSGLSDRARSGPPPRCELCRSPIVWGVGAAAVLGAIALTIAGSGSHATPAVTIQGGQFGGR